MLYALFETLVVTFQDGRFPDRVSQKDQLAKMEQFPLSRRYKVEVFPRSYSVILQGEIGE